MPLLDQNQDTWFASLLKTQLAVLQAEEKRAVVKKISLLAVQGNNN